ncbi:hypothetical protein [Galbibacter mesophilus]|uniref:hypothetical protein n=1 Tax=Galbibacter mesophilus TaxID=379069 RepID=UPI00191CC34E|nr:hypothetical protein [Galbibacter mesophilus]MCM5664280.1 hypothetical protein [Galbibacter mesophilus]
MIKNWINKNLGLLNLAFIFLFAALWIVVDNNDIMFQLAMLSGILFCFAGFITLSFQSYSKHIKPTDIEEVKSRNERKIILNKNPNDLKKVLVRLLAPKNEKQEQQINVFINNIFEWDSKYGTIPNYGTSLTFLNKRKVKLLTGFMFYLLHNKKITSQQSQPKKIFLECLMVTELKHLNVPNIGLSKDGLRKKFDANQSYFKEQFFSSSTIAQFKLFQ